MNCELLNVGTELLLGDILNTNAQFLCKELAQLGINVKNVTTVGDNEEKLTKSLQCALEDNDIVITTGGLGPTADDLTKEVCCKAMGCKLYKDEESYQNMCKYFKKFNHPMPETNVKQAMMPEGCVILKNDYGTAPGCAIEKDNKIIIMLPGPPSEVKPMFNNHVKPYLEKFSDGVIVSCNVRTFGIGESKLDETVKDVLEQSNPTVAPYAKTGEAYLRVTAKADTKEEAESMLKPVVDNLYERLGSLIYTTDKENIEQRVIELLEQKNMTLAVAESCTGGYIAKRITDVSGSSGVFECGVVSYSNRIKNEIINVNKETLDKYTAVSEQVACEMAEGVLKLSNASIAVATTGISGPNSDGTSSPVGLSFIALTDGKDTWYHKLNTGREDQRDYNRYLTASHAFNMIRMYLEDRIEELDLSKK